MLKRRLIPKLQMRASRFAQGRRMVLVTTRQFGETVEIGDPVSQAKIYQAQAADELVFLDLDASGDNRQPMLEVVRRAAEQIFMPFAVGGGVRCLADFRALLSQGADKVTVNSAAVERPELISEAAQAFGAQCVVLSIDYRRGPEGAYRVWTHGGKVDTGLDPVAWAVRGQELGAGEIMLTSIDHDGARDGLDLDLTRRVSQGVTIPVITGGGCGLAEHFVQGFREGGADAVAAGTYFCFKDENPMQTRAQIKNAGIPIRLHT
jgi:cyclase